MADSEATKAAVEYWDRIAATAKRGTNAETVDRNLDNAETVGATLTGPRKGEERNSASRRSRRR